MQDWPGMRHGDASYYDRAKVEHDRTESRGMLLRESPKMFAFWLFFYAAMGLAIPWRMELSRHVIWNTVKASVLFGTSCGLVLLVVGAIFMRAYALHKAPYTDFGPAASLTMVLSFRLYGAIGIALALWNVSRIILPALGSAGEQLVRDWWMWLLMLGGVAGWFSGRSLGGLVGLLAIWWSGSTILKRL